MIRGPGRAKSHFMCCSSNGSCEKRWSSPIGYGYLKQRRLMQLLIMSFELSTCDVYRTRFGSGEKDALTALFQSIQ